MSECEKWRDQSNYSTSKSSARDVATGQGEERAMHKRKESRNVTTSSSTPNTPALLVAAGRQQRSLKKERDASLSLQNTHHVVSFLQLHWRTEDDAKEHCAAKAACEEAALWKKSTQLPCKWESRCRCFGYGWYFCPSSQWVSSINFSLTEKETTIPCCIRLSMNSAVIVV